ncbi:MAG: acyl-ACP--UDP-N-acetylglucosamine O-acyltransferase [Deltaproteobacteria bacterium]|nr:acyl-ACP--UDP-N-acetylglucosamine O-acyltransferase [Deltaproteobacteria bacterium]
MAIHPTAIVHKGAQIDSSAEIGPFCIVGPKVKIGPYTRLLSHVVIDNDTTIGARNVIYPFASVGGTPQDLKFKGEPAQLIIGDENVIRESATIHIGTQAGHMETRIGNGCLLMAYIHIAHDCILGNRIIMSNSVGLAGHVTIDDNVVIAGLAGIHQFCQIGRNAYITGASMVAQSVPPFCIAKGDRAQLVGINIIGLKRAGFNREKIRSLRLAFNSLFYRDQNQYTFADALARTEAEFVTNNPEVKEICQFIHNQQRGICPGRAEQIDADSDDTSAE